MNLPEPFLGRLVLEVIKEDVKDYYKKLYGMENSMLELPDTVGNNCRVPFKKGKILKKAPDAFGDAFKRRYGNEGYMPDVGDLVWFIPNDTYVIDEESKYHLIADQDIVAYERG